MIAVIVKMVAISENDIILSIKVWVCIDWTLTVWNRAVLSMLANCLVPLDAYIPESPSNISCFISQCRIQSGLIWIKHFVKCAGVCEYDICYVTVTRFPQLTFVSLEKK